jgi:hypothetical protein
MRLPLTVTLLPRRHCDLTDVPDDLAAEMGRLVVAISAAVESLPSVGAPSSPSTATSERTCT